MQRARYKKLLSLILLAFISSIAYAEKGDNTAPSSVGEQPAVLTTTSYFQGTWVGNWQPEDRSGTGRDISIAVGPKNPDGTFDIEYSWGMGTEIGRGRAILPGTVKTKGREDGGILKFEFNDPANLKTNDIVMTKHEDARAKARIAYGMGKYVAYLRRI
jgi:hypothetical protein